MPVRTCISPGEQNLVRGIDFLGVHFYQVLWEVTRENYGCLTPSIIKITGIFFEGLVYYRAFRKQKNVKEKIKIT